jgi:predicted Fe-Mo cluster-binding NifX family protein
MAVKIAAVTEDGLQLSSHFGMAPEYRVYHVEEGQVAAEETRPKPHHAHHPGSSPAETHSHRSTPGHEDMFAPIRDCQVLLVGGMGTPAFEKALASGLEVVLAGGEIQAALNAYLRGELKSDPRRVHRH